MILKKYFFNITIRVILLIITCYLFSVALQIIREEYYYTTAGLGFLIILQVYLLIKYLNRINRELALFFSAIQNSDSTLVFPALSQNKSTRELHNALNNVNTIIQQIKTESEKKGIFLKNVINHVDIGLLAYDQEGNIEFFNDAASKITGMRQAKNIAEFEKQNKDFFKILRSVKPGENKVLRTSFYNNHYDLSIKTSIYKFEEQKLKLVSFQNIKHELERKELESWQKLIRILNHEIMNSLSPVLSLTKTLITYFKNKDKTVKSATDLDDKTVHKTLNGLATIEETGAGLIEFINNYRSITSLPLPNLKKTTVNELFQNILTLLNEQLRMEEITVETDIFPEKLEVTADINQLSQVIINLIFNSIEALKNATTKKIILKSRTDLNENLIIEIIDNGKGIPREIIDDIFIPFFSTKESGSGIGLSLARQIMKTHNGTISVQSTPGETIFTLKFQKA
jgi:two-component system, NtrC family, nitrogen regulation sensor histidine kinase NtrY